MGTSPGLTFDRATSLVARNLGVTKAELLAGFQPAISSELPDILSLREAVHGGPPSWDDHKYLAWRYGLRSSGRSHATFRTLRVNGKLIAGVGAEEFTLAAPDGAVQAACAMDILCLEGYRDIGLGAWLNLALFEQYPVVLAMGSNENSRGLVKSLYRTLGPRVTLQFPIDARAFVSKRVAIPVLGSVFGALANVCIQVHRGWFLWRCRSKASSVRQIEKFTVDMNLESRIDAQPGRIAIVRNPEYLNWRYLENPRAQYRCIGLFDGDALRSYLIYLPAGVGPLKHSFHIADWWVADSSNLHPLRILVAQVVIEARRHGAHFLAADAIGSEMVRELRMAGFMRSTASGMVAGWHVTRHVPPCLHAEGISWCLTRLGEDLDQG